MTFRILIFSLFFIVPLTANAQTHITEHLQTVEAHLRAKDVSQWPQSKQEARAKTLNDLRVYHQRGVYPKNLDFPDAQVPYFVDDVGTNCAVAELMVESGYDTEVERIAATENNQWLYEMTSPDLERWTDAAGISIEEASWIQPSYAFCIVTEFVDAPQQANCGETIELSVRELECDVGYLWRLFRNETLSATEFPNELPTQTYTIPSVTLDGERFTFDVETTYDDEFDEGMEVRHTVVVACEGQEPAPPIKEKPSGADMGSDADVGVTSDSGVTPDADSTVSDDKLDQGCSTTASNNSTWLIFGLVFVFRLRRKRE